MKNNVEIFISTRLAYLSGKLLLVLLTMFIVIGLVVSPHDQNGQPVLLLLEVKAYEDYRQTAQNFLLEFNTLDREISDILSGIHRGDLFSQSHQTQKTFQKAYDLTMKIDRMKVPIAATGVHEQIYSISMRYLEIARLVMQWISTPEASIQEQIDLELAQARSEKTTLEKSQWMNHP